MALLNYFKVCKQSGDRQPTGISYLPDDNGPLSKEVLSSAIAAANSSVTRMMEICQWKQAGEYQVFTGKEKAEVAKKAAVYGISDCMKIEPTRTLPSSSEFDWKEQYQKEVKNGKVKEKRTLKLQSFLVRREVRHFCWAMSWMDTSNRIYEMCAVMEWWSIQQS